MGPSLGATIKKCTRNCEWKYPYMGWVFFIVDISLLCSIL